MDAFFKGLGVWITRFRWPILITWIGLLVVGLMLTGQLFLHLEQGNPETPGAESGKAAALIEEGFAGRFNQSLFVVFHSDRLTVDDPAFKEKVTFALEQIGREDKIAQVTSYLDERGFAPISQDRHTTFATLQLNTTGNEAVDIAKALRDRVNDDVGEVRAYLTGESAFNLDQNEYFEEQFFESEQFGLPIVFVVLVVAFGAVVAAGLPLALGFGSVAITFALLFFISYATPIFAFVPQVAGMIGLGIGIDYSLIMLSRFREELLRGKTSREAIVDVMRTAGKAVAFSGMAATIALAALIIIPVGPMRSIGYAAVIVVAVAAATALTVLPGVLLLLGNKVNLLTLPFRKQKSQESGAGLWHGWTIWLMRRPWWGLAAALVILIGLSIPIFRLETSIGNFNEQIPEDRPSRKGLELLRDQFAGGETQPIQVVVQSSSGAVWSEPALSTIYRLSEEIKKDSRVKTVRSLVDLTSGASLADYQQLYANGLSGATQPGQRAILDSTVNQKADVAIIEVLTQRGDLVEDQEVVEHLRQEVVPNLNDPNLQVYVGGLPGLALDFTSLLNKFLWPVIGLTLALTFVVLLVLFRSLFVPLKAVVANLLSVSAAFGVLVLVFKDGFLSGLLGFEAPAVIFPWVPIMTFAILFGLSMDYEVFLLSRIRERYDETGNNREAVAYGLQCTAGVITSAAAIIIAVQIGFAATDIIFIKELAIGLIAAVALDATVVRLILVPAVMELMGKWNWWLPGRKPVPVVATQKAVSGD